MNTLLKVSRQTRTDIRAKFVTRNGGVANRIAQQLLDAGFTVTVEVEQGEGEFLFSVVGEFSVETFETIFVGRVDN